MRFLNQECTQEDEGGGGRGDNMSNRQDHPLVSIRHSKRAKVEPLSPASVHSGDESSSNYDSAHVTQLTELQVPRMLSALEMKFTPEESYQSEPDTSEDDNSDDEDNSDDLDSDIDVGHHEISQAPRSGQASIPSNIPSRVSAPPRAAVSAVTITATTPPQTPPPPQETETAITTNLSDEFDDQDETSFRNCLETGHDISNTNEVICDQNRHSYPPTEEAPRVRDRVRETRLSDEQREHLNMMIKSIKEGHLGKLRDLLEDGRRKYTKNLLNIFVRGNTALHHALLHGRGLAWCKLLVASGADPTLTNLAGWHPIHLAAHNAASDTMSYIISLYG